MVSILQGRSFLSVNQDKVQDKAIFCFSAGRDSAAHYIYASASTARYPVQLPGRLMFRLLTPSAHEG